jgi:hypothetical protein
MSNLGREQLGEYKINKWGVLHFPSGKSSEDMEVNLTNKLRYLEDLEEMFIKGYDKVTKLKSEYDFVYSYIETEIKKKEGGLIEYYSAKDTEKELHKFWWDKLKTTEKIRNHPREFLSYGTFGTFAWSIFSLLGNLILKRDIIAPDYGFVIMFVSGTLWLMTQAAKKDFGGKNE